MLTHILRSAALGTTLAFLLTTLGSAQNAPDGGTAPATTPQPPRLCPLSVRVYTLDGHDDEAVFALWSDKNAGVASGTIAVYAGDRRYRIGFLNAVAADDRNTKELPTPIVLRFSGPTHVDSAYVESLSDGDCTIHEPYVTSEKETYAARYGKSKTAVYPDWSQAMATFMAQAAAKPPLDAPAGEIVAAPACSKPYVMAYTTKPVAAAAPAGEMFNGEVAFKVDVNADGSLRAVRVEKSSRLKPVDRAAFESVARSQFAPQIYRCIPVSGDYMFYVKFEAS
jgi:TonB family protein